MIKLTGKTSKGKQRVKRDGTDWTVVREHNGHLPFAPSDNGPWLLIESSATKDTRWVRKTNDNDFIVSFA